MIASDKGPKKFGPYFVVVPATTAMGALSSSLGGPVAAIVGAVVGLCWGLIIGLASNWLNRHMPKLSRRWIFLAAFVATTLFGGTGAMADDLWQFRA